MRRLVLVLLVACGQPPAPAPSPTPLAATPPADPAGPAVDNSALWPPRQVDGYDPRTRVRLTSIPAFDWDGDDYGSPHFRDIMTHASGDARFAGDHPVSTVAHETHHGLVVQAANRRGSGDEFIYFERGYGAFIAPPHHDIEKARVDERGQVFHRRVFRTSLAQIRDYVPNTARRLAAGRYATYLDDPTRSYYGAIYLLDEWNAYLAGGRVSIETFRAGSFERAARRSGIQGYRIDAVDGMVDFLWFASAAMLALDELEPGYLAGNEQLRAIYALLAEETARLFAAGRTIPAFRGFHGEELFDAFATAPDNVAVRAFLRRWLGGAWTRRVLGF